MIQNIIFDWSGVINDNFQQVLNAANGIFSHFGVSPIDADEFRKTWEQPYMVFYNKYIPHLGLKEEQRLYLQELAKQEPPQSYSGVPELLHELSNSRKKLFVLSSDHPDTFYPELKKFGLEKVFSHTYVDVHDKREIIEEIMKRHAFIPKETVFVGDSVHEVETGKKVGIQTVGVTWGFQNEERLIKANPDYLCRTVSELQHILVTK